MEREELYDLLEDPGQQHNVFREHAGVTAELRGRVLAWRGSRANHHRPQDLSPKTREELRALGYVD